VLIDVLANDGDVDGDELTLAVLGSPVHGTAVIEDGRIRYTPAADFNGADSFSYRISDPAGESSEATVSVTVNPVNDGPVLDPVPDQELEPAVPLALQLSAQDADGDVLSWHLLAGPAGATIDPVTGLVQWAGGWPGSQARFIVAVRDPHGAEASRAFLVRVRWDEAVALNALRAASRMETPANSFVFMPQPIEVPVLRFGYGFQALSGAPGPAMPVVLDEGAGRIVKEVRLEPDAKPIRVQQPAGRDARLVLRVERFQPTADGFAVRFSERILGRLVETGRDGSVAGAPEVLVLGPDGQPLTGSILMDADGKGFRFVASGPLATGAYRVVLRSGLDGFHSFFGQLDGDGDGLAGGDYRQGFEVEPEASAAQAGAAEAPAIDFGRSYAGFALAGTLAFGAVARRGQASRQRRPEAEFIAPRDGDATAPNDSLKIRLDS
jgi:hypothetical protein